MVSKPKKTSSWLPNRMFHRFCGILCNFLAFTSIHGANHIADDLCRFNQPSTRAKYSKRTIRLAKCSSVIFWGVTILNCVLLAILMTTLIWERLQKTPILNTVDTYDYPIANVKFPAVTLCNLNVVYRPAMEKILKEFIDSGFNETILRNMFSRLHYLLEPQQFHDNEYSLEFERAMQHYNYTYNELMFLLMQPCDRMLLQCSWLNRIQPCSELFSISTTSKGFCCSFNTFDHLRTQNQSHYYVSVENQGLSVILAPEPDEYVSYYRTFYGIQVAIHNPDDFPVVDSPLIVQANYDMNILVEPTVLLSDRSIKDLQVSQRKCAFQDERKSQFLTATNTTRRYTYRHCMIDCIMESSIKHCNCTPFYHVCPKFKHPITCKFSHMNCMWNMNNDCSSEVSRAISLIHNYKIINATKSCQDNCLPDCEEVKYHIQAVQRNREKSRDGVFGYDDDNVKNHNATTKIYLYNKTRMSIGFMCNTCIAYKQTVYMTWDNFFASVGGIFGLCLGASIVSFIEVIYFVVVRIIGSIFLSIPTNKPSTVMNKKEIQRKQQKKKTVSDARNPRINNLYSRQYMP